MTFINITKVLRAIWDHLTQDQHYSDHPSHYVPPWIKLGLTACQLTMLLNHQGKTTSSVPLKPSICFFKNSWICFVAGCILTYTVWFFLIISILSWIIIPKGNRDRMWLQKDIQNCPNYWCVTELLNNVEVIFINVKTKAEIN